MPQIKSFKDYYTKSFDEQVNGWLEENAGKILIHQFLYGGAGGGDTAYLCLTVVYDEVKDDMFGENIKKQQ